MFTIPTSETNRMDILSNYILIPTPPKGRNFFTFHPDNNLSIEWRVATHQSPTNNNNVPYFSVNPNIAIPETKILCDTASGTIAAAQGADEHYMYGHKIYINTTQATPTDIIEAYLAKVRATQTNEHFTQFIIATHALHQIISPDEPIKYVGINPLDEDEQLGTYDHIPPNHYPIYSIHSEYDIERPNIPPIQQHTIPDASMSSHIYAHLHTHNISHEGYQVLNDIFGPWQHAVLNENISASTRDYNIEIAAPYLSLHSFETAEWFIPPVWPGCPDLRTITAQSTSMSQHQWIGLQRKIQHTINQIRPHITPA